MTTLVLAILLIVIGLVVWFVLRQPAPLVGRGVLAGCIAVAVLMMLFASFTVVKASHRGVVTTFGKIQPEVLDEGLHWVLPWSSVHQVYTGVQFAYIGQSPNPALEAGSKDLQAVHTTLTVNFHPDAARARELYAINTTLSFGDTIVPPATAEVFKSVVSQYTAEELITKRAEVSASVTRALGEKLAPYFLVVQSVQMVNFGFSKSFDAAIEEKVTASQKAATAQRNLERTKFEAESRIAQAKGEAEAIRIQAESVSKAGGEEYVRLKAVEKWDGKLPHYVTGGAAVPFVNVK